MSDTTLPDDEVQRLGAYIKAKRTELRLSLRDLAETTDLSATFLSNLERGVANPTLESLRKVSNALNIPILFMANAPHESSPVVRRNQRRHLNLSNGKIRYEILTPTLTKKMVLFEACITADDGNIVVGPLAEPTEECLVVLSGQISVCIADQNYELEAGDSIYFEGRNLESIMAMGDVEARFISAITPPVFKTFLPDDFMQNFDVIIIGGGFLGVSTAYQLSKAGVRTLLLEAGDIGSGTSGSCCGRAQVCEGHLDPLNVKLIREGFKRHETLEYELGLSYEWRKAGLLLLLRNENLWEHWKKRSEILSSSGIKTEVIDQQSLQRAEPNLNANGMLGAAYSIEGMLNPLRFTHAYAGAATRQGATLLRNSKVVGMEVRNHRVTEVKTITESYSASTVAVMAGAWEHIVTRMAGVEVPIRPIHAESLITEPIPPMIFHNIGLADSYEIINGKAKACTMGIHPEPNGSLDIAEAVTQTEELHQRSSAWGICAMAADLVKLYPFLEKVRVVRSWGRPTSFTPDEEPLIGWVPQLENMYVATSLVETITAVPVLSEWMAMMIQGQIPPESLDLFSPARFVID